VISPVIAVLTGGTSSEREVSLGSGRSCAQALARSYPTELVTVDAEALPSGLDPKLHVVFSTLHGTFGEDGGMQALLEAAGFAYTGFDAAASRLAMDKTETKEAASAQGVKVADGIIFLAAKVPTAEEILSRLGPEVVIKPNNEGSSVGLSLPKTREELESS